MDRTKHDPAPPTTADLTSSQPGSLNETQAAGGPPPALAALPQAIGGYRVVKLLGQGGMGAVYHARDDQLDRDLAVKTMKPEVAAQPGAVERFLREARTAAKVEHDNVIPILHIGTDRSAADTPYIAMPLLKGLPLDKWLRGEVVAPLGVVLKVGRETADGLAAAHELGLIHRDIKPANIWIEGDPRSNDLNQQFRRVKILDFGLARAAADDTHLTNSGAVVGTPAYMSPEQARGDKVDFRTDLWSLGVVLYRMTTGRMPFVGASTMAVLMSLGIDTPPEPHAVNRAVPVPLSDLIMRLLSKEREHRPAGAAHVAAELRNIGRQLADAARQSADAALSQNAPVPVPRRAEVPLESNPFAGIDVIDPTEAEDADEGDRTEAEALPPPAPVRGRGVWLAAGGLLAAVMLAAVAVVIFSGSKKQPDAPPDTAKGEAPKPTPVTPKPSSNYEADRKAAEWVLSVGGRVAVATTPELAAKAIISDAGRVSLTDSAGTHERAALPTGPSVLAGVRLFGWRDAAREAELAVFADCRYLTYVHIGNSFVTGTGLRHLKGCPKLAYLSLYDNPIEDANLEHIRDLTSLVELDLDFAASVTDAGVKHLAGLTNLTRLGLHRTKTTDAGLDHLTGLKNLDRLVLSGTAITVAGLQKLSQALPKCTIHSDHGVFGPLKFERDAVDWAFSVGGRMQLVATGSRWLEKPADLPANESSIEGLVLPGPRVTDDALARLPALPQLTYLSLLDSAVTDAGLKHLARHPKLSGVVLSRTKITDAGLDELKGLRLGELYVAKTGVTDIGMQRIAAIRTLTAVIADDTEIGDVGVAQLKRLPNLRVLHLEGTKVTDAWAADIGAMKKLEHVRLSRTGLTDAALDDLAKLTNLNRLDLSGTKVTADGVKKLEALLPKCQIVSDHGVFGRPVFTPRAAAEWAVKAGGKVTVYVPNGSVTFHRPQDLPADTQRLVRIDFTGAAVGDQVLDNLAGQTGLRELVLTNTTVTLAGVERCAKSLPRCVIHWNAATVLPSRALPVDPTPRQVVEWARIAGSVQIRINGQDKYVMPGDPLPDGPFTVIDINMGPDSSVTDADLAELAKRPGLDKLSVAGPYVSDTGLKHVAKLTELTAFSAYECRVTDAGAADLAGLTKLTHLSLSKTTVTDAALKHLKGMTSLTSLHLDRTLVTDAGLEALKELAKLEHLFLSGTKLTGSGFAHLKGLTKLHAVRLDGSAVTDDGLASLVPLKSLAGLDLSGTAVTDAGMDHVAALPGLTSLILNGTKVTAAGVARVKKARPDCNIATDAAAPVAPVGAADDRKAGEWVLGVGGYVQVRDGAELRHVTKKEQLPPGPIVVTQMAVGGRGITDDGLAAVRDLTALTSVHLNGTQLTDAGLKHFAAAKGLQMLFLTGTAVTDAGLEHLRGHTALTQLDLGGTKVTGVGLGKLVAAKGLTQLDLEGCKFGDGDLAAVAAFPELRRLHLRLNPVSDAGLKHLAGLTKLTELNLTDTRVKGPGLAHLAALKRLSILDLSSGEFTDAGLEHLTPLTGLTDLNLSGTRVTGAGFEHLKALPALANVRLHNVKLTDASLAHLATIPKLNTLNLNMTPVTDVGLKHLRDWPAKGLQKLHLDDTAVSDAGVEYLTALPLTGLTLSRSKVTAAGVAKLRKALPNCKIVSDHDGVADRKVAEWAFSVGGHVAVRVGGGGAARVGGVLAAKDLPKGPFVLTRVSLTGPAVKIDDAALVNLKGLTGLTELALAGETITDAGLEHLRELTTLEHLGLLHRTKVTGTGFEHLKGLPKLTTLSLDHSAVTDAGFAHVGRLKGLTRLFVIGVRVTDAGLEHLKGLNALEELVVNDTDVTDAGLKHLVGLAGLRDLEVRSDKFTDAGLDHLKNCTKLRSLRLTGNAVSDAGLERLIGLTDLRFLELQQTQVTADGVAKIKKALPKCHVFWQPPKK